MRSLLVALLATAAAFGQTRPASSKNSPAPKSAPAPAAPVATKWPIVSLAVEGNRHFTPQQVLAVAGLKIGQLAGKEEFDAARDRLVACGYFEMVAYRFEPAQNQEGEKGTFQVTEVDALYSVRFEGLGVPAAELEAALRARDPLFSMAALPPTKPMLDRYLAWVQEFVAGKGSGEKIAARVEPAGNDKLEIVFRPARNLPVVAQVTFEGNRVLPQNVLRDAISGVAVGVPYTPERFQELLNTAVRPRYEARGRLRVKFTNVRTEPATDVQGLHVFVTVDEGVSYQLAKLEIAGQTPVRPETLLKVGDIPTGDVANFDRITDGMERMRQALARAGYLEAKLDPQRTVDDAKKAVDVAVHVEPGPQFLMGKLTITGLDLDGEAEIRRIWTIKEGKPYNPDYPEIFLKGVRDQGLFDNLGETKPEVQINDQNHTVDVTLKFAGAPPAPKQGRGRGGFGQ
jgi:outer membrane protein insertion porin family